MNAPPTQDELKELFDFDGGKLIWRERPRSHFKCDASFRQWNTKYAFKPAGYIGDGYIRICIRNRMYQAHRLIWLREFGYMPNDIDHINGCRSDNRLENLRSVTPVENSQNAKIRSDNTSGCVGVSLRKSTGRFKSYLYLNGRKLSLGDFADLKDAITARKNAEIKFGFHPNHGRAA